jgi:hypothetical protein
MSVSVLEHVDDKYVAMNEFARVTKKGGFFVGCSTNVLNPILWFDAHCTSLMKPLVSKIVPGEYDRHSRFSPSSLIDTLESSGYNLDGYYLLGDALFVKKDMSLQSLGKRQYVTKGMSNFIRFWVVIDKITRRKPLLFFKEILVWQANRT